MRNTLFGPCCISLFFISSAAVAGPLNPPAGPVTPTPLPLEQVEPRTPLSQDTTPGDASSVFIINTPGSYYLISNIDANTLNGIQISAPRVSLDLNGFAITNAADAIQISSGGEIHIANGTVFDTTGHGINGTNRTGVRLSNLNIVSTDADGIRLGEAADVHHCLVQTTSGIGVAVGENSLVSNCRVSRSMTTGISAARGSEVMHCTIYLCTTGVSIASRGRITLCNSLDNLGAGIVGSQNSTIDSCVSSGNITDGISVGNDCVLIGNTCRANATGIRLTAGDNRIEGNHVTDSSLGIVSEMGGNLIIRNSLAGNATSFSLPGVDTIGPTVPAGPIASTNPWSNFEF